MKSSKPLFITFVLSSIALVAFFAAYTSKSSELKIENNKDQIAVTPTEKMNVSHEVLSYFDEVAMGAEYGDNSPRIRKWTKPKILITLAGTLTQDDRACLDVVISDFNALSSETKMQIAQGSHDVTINFAPESSFSTIEPNYQPTNYGYFWVNFHAGGSIARATILISTTDITQAERCHIIREELTQSTGLMKDSHRYASSIFYDDWTTTSEYSEIDKQLIRMLYGGNGVRPDDSREAVKARFILKEQ